MITLIAINENGETHIRRYSTDSTREARDLFVHEWINGGITWLWWEYYGPHCTVDNPAFTPTFLTENGFDDEPAPLEDEGVIIYSWFCATGIHGSDEHFVTGYFVPSR